MQPRVLGRSVACRRCLAIIRRFSRCDAGVSVELVVFVEEAVVHGIGPRASLLTAALVLLDGFVQGPELTQEGHVLLPQPHLDTEEAGLAQRLGEGTKKINTHPRSILSEPHTPSPSFFTFRHVHLKWFG